MDYILAILPVAIYFLAKLIRYYMLKVQDNKKSPVVYYILLIIWALLSVLVLPLSVVGFIIDNLYSKRDYKQSISLARFVRKITELQTASGEEQMRYAKVDSSYLDWDFDLWVQNELSKYSVYPEDVGIYMH